MDQLARTFYEEAALEDDRIPRSETLSVRRLREIALGSRWLSAMFTGLMLGFCALVLIMLAELRRETFSRAETGANNILSVVSQDIARNVELYSLSLRAVADGLQNPMLSQLDPQTRQAVLFDRAATAKYLGTIVVLDEHGNATEDSEAVPPRPGNFADGSYFRAQLASQADTLFISAPFTGQFTGSDNQVIALSLRLSHPDGSFAGVVVGTIDLGYFKDLFHRFDLGGHGAVTLLNTDGVVLMRAPYDMVQIGADLSANSTVARFLTAQSGNFSAVAKIDGVRRIFSFSHIGQLPLVLTIALSEGDIYASWYVLAGLIALVLLVLCAATGGLALLFKRTMRRRSRTEARTRISEARYRLLADNSTDVIVRLNPDMTRRYVSPASLSVLGYSPSELAGKRLGDEIPEEDWVRIAPIVREAQRSRLNAEMVYRFRHKSGSFIWLEAHYSYIHEDSGFIVVLRDISARKETESRLEAANSELTRLAATDGLTGLANRRRFDEGIEQEWSRAGRDELPLSLLLIDVDCFKLFNDRYGHQEGDACLRAVSTTLLGCADRAADMVARYGGEELVVLLPGTDEIGAAMLADRALAAVAALAIPHDGNPEHGGVVTVSIGYATAIPPNRADEPRGKLGSPADLIAAADRALYRAKLCGRNCVAAGTDRHLSGDVLEAVFP